MSLHTLLNPQGMSQAPWLNIYVQSVNTNGMKFGTSSVPGNLLGALDSSGTIGFIAGSGSSGGFVTSVTSADETMIVTPNDGAVTVKISNLRTLGLTGSPPQPVTYTGAQNVVATDLIKGVLNLDTTGGPFLTSFANGIASQIYTAMGSPTQVGASFNCIITNVGGSTATFTNGDANLFTQNLPLYLYPTPSGGAIGQSIQNKLILTFTVRQISPPQIVIF